MARIQMAADLFDQISLMMVDLAAHPADKVEVVVGMPQFPAGAFIGAETRLPNQIQISEKGEGSVNRGGVDGRVGFVHLPDDLLHGEVATGAIQDFPDPEPGFGETISPIAEQFGQFSLNGHTLILLVANDSQQRLAPRPGLINEGVIVTDGETAGLLSDEQLLSRHRLEMPYRACPSATTAPISSINSTLRSSSRNEEVIDILARSASSSRPKSRASKSCM